MYLCANIYIYIYGGGGGGTQKQSAQKLNHAPPPYIQKWYMVHAQVKTAILFELEMLK